MRKKSVRYPDEGLFITLEGPEGAGKSSQAEALVRELEADGFTCLLTREPGGTPLAEKIRAVLKGYQGPETIYDETELLLIEAARAQHMREKILPALRRGECVICDRFFDSTVAYQGGARGLSETVIRTLNGFASVGRDPDLTLLLDLPPEAGFARTAGRPETAGEYDRFEAEKLDFHRKVREAFLRIAQREPERVRVLRAEGSREEVTSDMKRIVHEFLR